MTELMGACRGRVRLGPIFQVATNHEGFKTEEEQRQAVWISARDVVLETEGSRFELSFASTSLRPEHGIPRFLVSASTDWDFTSPP